MALPYEQMIAAEPSVVFFAPCNDAGHQLPYDVVGRNNCTNGSGGFSTGGIAALGGICWAFPKAGQEIIFPHPALLSGDLSVEAWFVTTASLPVVSEWFATAALLMNLTGQPGDFGLGIMGAGVPIFGTAHSNTSVFPASGTWNFGYWHHVVGTYVAATRALTLYVDGIQVASVIGSPTALLPGADTDGLNIASFIGAVCGLAIYSSALSPGIVQNHYNLGATAASDVVPVLASDLAAPYRALITSEHNQRPKFMAVVDVLCQAMAEIRAGTVGIQASFDLDVAIGNQLDIIGLWIGQSRIVPNVLIEGYFGFADNFTAKTFGELRDRSIGGRFYELGSSFANTATLGDADYRTVLRAVIVRNQAKGDFAPLEEALLLCFGIVANVTDTGNFGLSIHLNEPLAPTDLALVVSNDILPRPAGVSIDSITFVP